MSGDAFEIRIEKWPNSFLPNAIWLDHKGRPGGTLTDGDQQTYWFLTLWGRKDGRVWARREELAKARGVTSRALRIQIEKLVAAGWIDRATEQQRGGEKVVLTLRMKKQEGATSASPGGDNDVTPETDFRGGGNEFQAPLNLISSHKGQTPLPTGCAEDVNSEPVRGEVVRREVVDPIEGGEPASQARQDSLHPLFQEGESPDGEGQGREEKVADEETETASEPSWIRADRQSRRKKAPPPRRTVTNNNGKPADSFEPPPPTLPAAQWPPEKGRDIYYRWGEEVVAKHPSFRVAPINSSRGKDAAIAKKLGERYDADTLLHIIRMAIWDWRAIQETIDPWYTKEAGPVPTLQHILKLAPQLTARIGKGVISTTHRVSAYRSKFVEKYEQQPSPDGMSFAERMRKKTRDEWAAKHRRQTGQTGQTGGVERRA